MSNRNNPPDCRKPYHHGALRSALVEASVALAREGGPGRVILREAARVAGVSHSAAYRHFADREALLAEVSHYARTCLGKEMRRRLNLDDDPRLHMRAVGYAYIDFALSETGLFRCAFTSPSTAVGDPTVDKTAMLTEPDDPFRILSEVLDEVMAGGYMEPRRRPGAEIGTWSSVHGLACLLIEGTLPNDPASVESSMNLVLDHIGRSLLTEPAGVPRRL